MKGDFPASTLRGLVLRVGAALRARRVSGATPHRGRGDQARPAHWRIRGSRRLDRPALDGTRPEVAVPAGESLRADGSVRRAWSSRLDGSDRMRAWRGAQAAPAASIPGAGCQCRTSSLRVADVRSVAATRHSNNDQVSKFRRYKDRKELWRPLRYRARATALTSPYGSH
jgi:hypothetical protein